ncbi:putative mitochondrial protein [Cucumis melo var. makuwa]|uniref:Mitochondrial protein n=1 Tax=Cucumis melo var. makuwa TaxID=1194695 RepID=A0A5D3BSC9_CUCMM|nr:putative mitochondrial protein [Cucumis melo var. makuwa]TYK01908.1 putative mitochondrial protein [Cucumis melo var. makuwa]
MFTMRPQPRGSSSSSSSMLPLREDHHLQCGCSREDLLHLQYSAAETIIIIFNTHNQDDHHLHIQYGAIETIIISIFILNTITINRIIIFIFNVVAADRIIIFIFNAIEVDRIIIFIFNAQLKSIELSSPSLMWLKSIGSSSYICCSRYVGVDLLLHLQSSLAMQLYRDAHCFDFLDHWPSLDNNSILFRLSMEIPLFERKNAWVLQSSIHNEAPNSERALTLGHRLIEGQMRWGAMTKVPREFSLLTATGNG